MAGEMLFMANPRGRKRKYSRRRYRRNPDPASMLSLAGANPRRRHYRRNPMGAGRTASVIGTILPVGLGVAAGLLAPKVFKLTGAAAWLVPVGIGLAGNIVLRPLMGSKSANLFSAGILSSVIIYGLDALVFKKQGNALLADAETTGGLAASDPIPVISDIPAALQAIADAQEVTGMDDVQEDTSDDMPLRDDPAGARY